jgi:flavin reductase (DIM6/NTAB) family NADH-FMN oxidoreductase RutF
MKDTGPLALDPLRFRALMGAFPTGVAVVTARRPDGSPSGLTVNSLTSVSLKPLLLLVCIDHTASSHTAILESGAFAVNLLGEGDSALSDVFATPGRDRRFDGLEWTDGPTRSPVLAHALGWIDCRVHQTHVAGDHTIVVGRVEAFDLAADAWPLVYHRGGYTRLERS